MGSIVRRNHPSTMVAAAAVVEQRLNSVWISGLFNEGPSQLLSGHAYDYGAEWGEYTWKVRG